MARKKKNNSTAQQLIDMVAGGFIHPISLKEIGFKWTEEKYGIKIVSQPEMQYGLTIKTLRPHNLNSDFNAPALFQVWRPADLETFKLFCIEWCSDKEINIRDEPDDEKKFAIEMIEPLFLPGATNSVFSAALEVEEPYKNLSDKWDGNLGIEPNPEPCAAMGKFPSKYVPARRWFPKHLEEIEIKDIVTIFPPAELEMFSYCIGRILCGPSGNYHVSNPDKPFEHGFRTLPLIYGVDAGIGKSYLMEKIVDTLHFLGYNTSCFDNFDETYDLRKIITSDLTYRDDLQESDLSKILKGSNTKSIITGASIVTREIYKASVTEKAICVAMANLNQVSPELVYGLDTGILDRATFLETLRLAEMIDNRKHATGASEGTPSHVPASHIRFLCEKYDIQEQTLFLWFFRLCADRFYNLVTTQHQYSEDSYSYAEHITRLRTKMRYRLNVKLEQNFMQLVQMCYVLRKSVHNPAMLVPQCNIPVLKEALKHTLYISLDKRAHVIRDLIKADWERLKRPTLHPWNALRAIRGSNLLLMTDVLETGDYANGEDQRDFRKALKAVFERLTFLDGWSPTTRPTSLTAYWEDARTRISSFKTLTNSIYEKLNEPGFITNEEERTKVINCTFIQPSGARAPVTAEAYEPQVNHVMLADYDPEHLLTELNLKYYNQQNSKCNGEGYCV